VLLTYYEATRSRGHMKWTVSACNEIILAHYPTKMISAVLDVSHDRSCIVL